MRKKGRGAKRNDRHGKSGKYLAPTRETALSGYS